jgi:ribosome-binding protein aMBF1 (putative translation factor)
MNTEDKKLLAEIEELAKNGDKIYERQSAERAVYFKNPANAAALHKANLSMMVAKMMHEARIAGGLTQQELADRMHTRQSYIAEVEKGKRNITIDTLDRYVAACGRRIEMKTV